MRRAPSAWPRGPRRALRPTPDPPTAGGGPPARWPAALAAHAAPHPARRAGEKLRGLGLRCRLHAHQVWGAQRPSSPQALSSLGCAVADAPAWRAQGLERGSGLPSVWTPTPTPWAPGTARARRWGPSSPSHRLSAAVRSHPRANPARRPPLASGPGLPGQDPAHFPARPGRHAAAARAAQPEPQPGRHASGRRRHVITPPARQPDEPHALPRVARPTGATDAHRS